MTADSAQSAYLVIREGRRWTDVFSLLPDRQTTIGRSSASQIVIQHERCSRRHAEIDWRDGQWIFKDLGSRNGSRIDGQPVQGEHDLKPGETLEIAGFQMAFVHDVAAAFGPDWRESENAGDEELSEQQTAEDIDPGFITHRRIKTPYLQSRTDTPPDAAAATQQLFRFAFELSRCETIDAAAEAALETLTQRTGIATGAVMRLSSRSKTKTASPGSLIVVATRSRPSRSYHRLPDSLASTVLRDSEAVLARNIRDDASLASPDTQGEISTTSTLCAPIRAGNKTIGLIHLYSSDDESGLEPEHLEFALAVAENLGLAFTNLLRQTKLKTRLNRSQQKIDELQQRLGSESKIIGESPEILSIRKAIARAAPTNATVLIRGESGVGKELVAGALHDQSQRRDGPFLCLNCAALSPTLLESELFGHEKGAFTGATDRKLGKFEAANGGTLMLDEIGEMSPEIQAKFLRVLEGHAFERVGGNRPIQADVRVISATNRDLELEVRESRFRADLYFRLHVLELVIPPLRDRGQDIIRLANHFLATFRSQMGRKIEGFTTNAERRMLEYSWPGNIRELKNVIERAVVLSGKATIDADDLVLSNVHVAGSAEIAAETKPFQPRSLSDMERDHILETMRSTGGNKSQAATILGIERSTLDRKLKRYELEPRDWIA